MPFVMVLGDGAFGKCLGHEDRALKHGINIPIKQKPTVISDQFQQVRTQASERGPSLDHIGTSSLQNYEKELAVYKLLNPQHFAIAPQIHYKRWKRPL